MQGNLGPQFCCIKGGRSTTEPADSFLYTAAIVERDCPDLLRTLGEQIVDHLEEARKGEDKVAHHLAQALRLLDEAKKNCDAKGFAAFRSKFCPDLGQSRAYELRAILTGKKSAEEVKAARRERMARYRAKKARSDSVTVTESTSSSAAPAVPDAKMSAQQDGDDQSNLTTFFAEATGDVLFNHIPKARRVQVAAGFLKTLAADDTVLKAALAVTSVSLVDLDNWLAGTDAETIARDIIDGAGTAKAFAIKQQLPKKPKRFERDFERKHSGLLAMHMMHPAE